MRAMVLHKGKARLQPEEVSCPDPSARQLRIKIEACGVCRTDLHIVDGDLRDPALPLIPGHEIVGRIIDIGADVQGFDRGQRVGVPWLGHTCGHCAYCRNDQENLCDAPGFTGYTLNGGYAQECVADARYVFALNDAADPAALAPLLCAGLIGFRSLRMAGHAEHVGFYGFGAAAHILTQIAVWQDRKVYAFTRSGDDAAQRFALETGALWAGGSDEPAPVSLDAALIFAPVGALVPKALKDLKKGGRVVCGGIHMSDIPSFPYDDLWQERQVMSVANLTREDGEAFFPLAQVARVRTRTTTYPLERANEALDDLRQGRLQGAAVLIPDA
ncbi:zinc-dependent alcohol dehydrogenase family protein [Roseobacter sp. YSTF-M11]|uniref:Zinc-dependent alcohol dehydrogenase family protein n=1 Tax=Roseobacter insulae TaxID=2859783 RepID=A0A9X1FRA6_9RHOB|nr:zinc-dependent alcohol dehydrogenase family protein [Roseobacter insulae]MBW4706202.1 zinc-dependent alcohol dehydrogenase family protein [Roseobacter insulae]